MYFLNFGYMFLLILIIRTISLKSIVLTNNGILGNRPKWEYKQFLKLEYGWCNDKFRNCQEVDDLKHLCFISSLFISNPLFFFRLN